MAMLNARIGAFCLVARDAEKLARFYSDVFGIKFSAHACEGLSIYAGNIGEIEFSLVPSSLSEVKCTENKTHWDIFVDDISAVIDAVKKSEGKTNGQLVEAGGVKCIGVFDPEGNFMPVKQKLP